MDLNEKIEARRRERLKETLEAQKAEADRKAIQKLEVEKEVSKRIQSMGIHIQQKSVEKPTEKEVNAGIEEVLQRAAIARMSTAEITTFILLFIFGILGFFVAWWVGVVFLVWAFLYFSKTTNRHRNELLAEGNTQPIANLGNECSSTPTSHEEISSGCQPQNPPNIDRNKTVTDLLSEMRSKTGLDKMHFEAALRIYLHERPLTIKQIIEISKKDREYLEELMK